MCEVSSVASQKHKPIKFLSYLAAHANGILYWAKRWHVCLAAFSTFWAVCAHKPRQNQYGETRKQRQLSFNDLPPDSRCYYFVHEQTLFISDVFMYGSAQCVMPFCNTFSIRATRKISAWGLVTEKMACKTKKKRVGRTVGWCLSVFCYNSPSYVQLFFFPLCLKPVNKK